MLLRVFFIYLLASKAPSDFDYVHDISISIMQMESMKLATSETYGRRCKVYQTILMQMQHHLIGVLPS